MKLVFVSANLIERMEEKFKTNDSKLIPEKTR